MQETTNIEAIKVRIAKLLKHAKSAEQMGSLEEAEVFSLKANQLLMEYNLEMSSINLNDTSNPFKDWGWAEEVSYNDNQSGSRWRLELIRVLTAHNLCSFTFKPRAKAFRVYGNMQNVDVVIWMYNYLSIGLLRLAQKAHVESQNDMFTRIEYSNRYSFLKDYLNGAVRGFDQKLRDERKKQETENPTVTSLIVLNKEALDQFIKKEMPNVKEAKPTKKIAVGSAYSVGKKAGYSFNVNKPLGTTASSQKSLS